MVKVKCIICKKEVNRDNNQLLIYPNTCCSKECKSKFFSKTMSGKNHPRYKGKRISSDGYMLVYSRTHPNRDSENMVREHRLIMEKHIGRNLKKTEVVHHENRNRLDNRIENLRLFKNHSEHLKYHTSLTKIKGKIGIFE